MPLPNGFGMYPALPVIKPLSLRPGSFLRSRIRKKPSRPCTSVVLAPNMNSCALIPTKPMSIAEPMRHGRLGSVGGEGEVSVSIGSPKTLSYGGVVIISG